jgi:hypothetical protein
MVDLLPVLWLCGPPGVGKSTVAWELFDSLPGTGYVDIDQLGMCFPETPEDPGRTVLEARILGSAVANFRAAGATGLIVSGYLDADRGIHAEHLPDAALTVLRLRCDLAELGRRLDGRPGENLPRDLVLQHAAALDSGTLPYPCLDTTGKSVAQVLAAVRDRWAAAPPRQPGPWPEPETNPPGEIVWVCGATASGKSTIGYGVYARSLSAGHTTGFVDLQQIGFLHPAPAHAPAQTDPATGIAPARGAPVRRGTPSPALHTAVHGAGNHRLKAANLAAAWRNFHAHGARRMVVVGHVDDHQDVRRYAEALAPAALTVVRLHAGPDELRERIRRRGLGGPPNLAGDQLRHQPAAVLAQAHAAAVRQAEALDRAGLGDLRIDTDGRPADEPVAEIADRLGWSTVG